MSDPTTSTTPTDDVGADTLDRYRFQAHLIARACVAMVVDKRISAVICEWHEDYVLQFANGPSELVSVKHHDGSQSHWTVKQLSRSGGLRHLFERYKLLGETCTCRLQTNEHLRDGSSQPAELRDSCATKENEPLRKWAETLASDLGATDVDQVERFLRVLTIEDHLPDRHLIEPVHKQELVPKLIESLGITDQPTTNLYEKLVSLAMAACTAPGHEIVLEALADPTQLSGDAERSRLLAAKTIDLRRVLTAVGRPPDILSVLLSARTDVTPARTRLAKKLEAGGVGATGVRSARRLRSNWEQHASAWSSGLPGDTDVIEDLRARVIRAAGAAEARTRRPGQQYANAMLDELHNVLKVSPISGAWPGPLTVELLEGLAYERTEACEIFWSDEFDPDAVP